MILKVLLFSTLALAGKSSYVLLPEGKLKCEDEGMYSIMNPYLCRGASLLLQVNWSVEWHIQSEADRPYGCRVQTSAPGVWVNTLVSSTVPSSKAHQVICKETPPNNYVAPPSNTVDRLRDSEESEEQPPPADSDTAGDSALDVVENKGGEFADEWRTIFECEGDWKTPDRIAADEWIELSKTAVSVRICTAGSETECVVSKSGAVALENLRAGSMSMQKAGLGKCDKKCIAQQWTGPEKLLNHLWWRCNPATEKSFYHACGNHIGLTMWTSKSHCEWDWGTTDSLVVQLGFEREPEVVEPVSEALPAPVPAPAPEPVTEPVGAWVTLFSCEGDRKTEDRAVDDWAEIAKSSTSVRVCTAGSETKCVVSKPDSVALSNLQAGNMNLQEAGLGKCDRKCVNRQWTGPDDLLKRLTWRCNPSFGGSFYHACGNHIGLHMWRSKSHCEWDWGTSNALVVQVFKVEDSAAGEPEVVESEPEVVEPEVDEPEVVEIPAPEIEEAEPEGEWLTLFSCEGDHKTANRIEVDDWVALSKGSSSVRVCTAGSDSKCVVSKSGSVALANLQAGNMSLQKAGLGKCDRKCINEQWTGPEDLMKRMTWRCNPNFKGSFYHACGNHIGLHMWRLKSHCEWDWGTSSPLVVQVFKDSVLEIPAPEDPVEIPAPEDPVEIPAPEVEVLEPEPQEPAGEWRTLFSCEGDHKTSDRIEADDWVAISKSSTSVRVCTAGSDSKCVVSKEESIALENLRAGNMSLQKKGLGKCDRKCINEQWTGPEDLMKRMTWRCNPNFGGSFYHACGNHIGLHMWRSKSHCEWDWGTSSSLVVQVFYEPKVEAKPVGEILIAENACVGTRGDAFGKFQVPQDITANQVRIVHKSGHVHCARGGRKCDEKVFGTSGGQRKSNFGCECAKRLGIFVTDSENSRVVPGSDVSLYKNAWYEMAGYTSHSEELKFEGERMFKAGEEYRVWYGEDLVEYTTSDNSGTACYDIFAYVI